MHDFLEQPGARVHTTRDGPVEAALAAVDVVVSVFSTCGYDALFLNRYSSRPLNTVLYLLFDPSMRAHVRNELAMDALPPVSAGLATAVLETEGLEPALDLACTAGERDRRWQASQSLPDPATSARRVLDTLPADFVASASSVARGA